MQGAHQHAQGHVALVGDAAHPMLPYLAQGAGMAIEDAYALAQCVRPQAEVTTGLQAFAHARWQRNARVQSRAMRNGDVFHARGLMRVGRDLGLRVLGERLMDVPWLYGHAQSDSSTDKP
jgi:salicylate hydroxylase